MVTLVETTKFVKKWAKWVGFGFFALILIRGLFSFSISRWKALHPPPPPRPEIGFGKLSTLRFPRNNIPFPSDFILETVEEAVPEATSTAKVYLIPKKTPKLLASQKAEEFAHRLGFETEPIKKTEIVFQFTDKKTPQTTLTLNTIDFNFFYQYDYRADLSIFETQGKLSIEKAKNEAVNFLQKANSFPSDIAKGEIKNSLLAFMGGNFVNASSLSQSSAIRIDFFRDKVDFPILPPEFNRSSVFVIIGAFPEIGQSVIEAQFYYQEVDYASFSTYPLKSSQQAFEELKQDKAYIVSWKRNQKPVAIRKVYLAYYDDPEYQKYLQPIFVFEGSDDFVAYVPAISPEFQE